jgi:hypothetical protein
MLTSRQFSSASLRWEICAVDVEGFVARRHHDVSEADELQRFGYPGRETAGGLLKDGRRRRMPSNTSQNLHRITG